MSHLAPFGIALIVSGSIFSGGLPPEPVPITEKPAAPIKRLNPVEKKLKPTPVAGVSNPAPVNQSSGGCDLAYIKEKESTNNYQAHSGDGNYHGAYQYHDRTWNGYGGYSRASDAPPSVQDRRASEDLAAGKQAQWSVC